MSAVAASDRTYLVIDASVSLKWALDDEDGVAEAVALRDDAITGRFEMVAPSLWLYEVTNGLVTAARRGRIAPDIGSRALSSLLSLGIRLVDPAADDVYQQSLDHQLAAYDAAYLALAEALGTQLWTGDRRFYAAVRDSVDVVHWIGDYLGRAQ
jgi:predicted nucleic acid-binding protein